MNVTYKIGDVVVLKSGGPRMTVEKVEADNVHCMWFEKDRQKRGQFPTAMLASGVRKAARIVLGGF